MSKRVILDKQYTEDQEPTEAEKIALAWDKAMRRTFKGIVPRRVAQAMLMRSPLNPANAEADDAE